MGYTLNKHGLELFLADHPHWKHEHFARRVGINRRTLQRILSGDRGMGERTRQKIARKFGAWFVEA